MLAPRLDGAARQALRKQLLALPPEQRADFIHSRLGGPKPAQ
jgi:DNA-directed RNA polymerase specialized sigma24 family protein